MLLNGGFSWHYPIKFHYSRVLLKIMHTAQQQQYIDLLVQERRNSSALAMELRISCINPSISDLKLTNKRYPHLALGGKQWGICCKYFGEILLYLDSTVFWGFELAHQLRFLGSFTFRDDAGVMPLLYGPQNLHAVKPHNDMVFKILTK